MVTMPGEAAADYVIIRDLVAAGMDCMRINCAHDDATAWAQMIEHLRRANGELRRRCRVSMDVGGPKLRTGSVTPGPAVIKSSRIAIRSARSCGRRWSRWLPPREGAASRCPSTRCSRLTTILRRTSDPDDIVEFDDARGKTRRLRVRAYDAAVGVAELDRTAVLTPERFAGSETACGETRRRVVNVPPLEQKLLLRKGDTLHLTRESSMGRPAIVDDHDRVMHAGEHRHHLT